MLTKDKKPAEAKGEVKDTGEVIPQKPETPKLYKAALEVATGQTFSRLKEAYKGATLEVFIYNLLSWCFRPKACSEAKATGDHQNN